MLDASALVKWFKTEGEAHAAEALKVQQWYREGRISIATTPLLGWELVNIASRRWKWPPVLVSQVAAQLLALDFAVGVPRLAHVVAWANRGLTAYDASYVARAEELGAVVVTDDSEMIRLAPAFVCPLAEVERLAA
ncbi:MAG: type II toxin-antitoxin system VapC family toxin [Chloroflexota bacterium]